MEIFMDKFSRMTSHLKYFQIAAKISRINILRLDKYP